MQEACLSKGSEQWQHTTKCESDRGYVSVSLGIDERPLAVSGLCWWGLDDSNLIPSVSRKQHGGGGGWFLST